MFCLAIAPLERQAELSGLICESFAFQGVVRDFALAVVKGLSQMPPHVSLEFVFVVSLRWAQSEGSRPVPASALAAAQKRRDLEFQIHVLVGGRARIGPFVDTRARRGNPRTVDQAVRPGGGGRCSGAPPRSPRKAPAAPEPVVSPQACSSAGQQVSASATPPASCALPSSDRSRSRSR